MSLQKIHELTKQVVPEGTVTDPLVIDPIRPTTYDYEDGRLLVGLSQIPNSIWIQLFQSQATTQFVGMGPIQTQFHGALAVVPVRRDIVVQQRSYFEGWIRNANGLYEESVRNRLELQKREREQALQKELAQKYAAGGNLQFRSSGPIHDRVLFADNRVWLCGQSLKDAAKKKPTYIVEHDDSLMRRVYEDIWANATPMI